MPTLVETSAFAAGHARPPLEPLQRLLSFEHLSKTIRFILSAKREAAQRAEATTEGRWQGWRRFIIDRIVGETPEIRSLYLRPEDRKPLCQPRAGQFVTARVQGNDGTCVTRCWSLSAYSQPAEEYRLTVRRQSGAGSSWAHEASVGSAVELRAPAGEFVLDMGSFRPIVLIAAGIGITPLLAMLQAHLSRGEKAAPVHLIYGARTPAHAAFRKDLEILAARHGHLHVHYVYSNSEAAGRPAGRITPDLVRTLLSDLHIIFGGHRIALPWYENDTYICGPGDFCVTLKEGLTALGANPDHMFYELFSVTPRTATEIDWAEVHFRRSGVSCIWHAAEDLTLLEIAERVGIAVGNDCRAGACLTCKTAVLEGSVTTDLGDGSALLCIGKPRSARVSLDC
jgi:ferredoxin-NADP reductase